MELMGMTNTLLLIVGIIVTLIGIGAFINPNIAKIINAPGGPRLKAIICIIIGIIIIIVGFAISLP
jgi:hypothetical protein